MPCTRSWGSSDRRLWLRAVPRSLAGSRHFLGTSGFPETHQALGSRGAFDLVEVPVFDDLSTGWLPLVGKLLQLGAPDSAASCFVSVQGGRNP